MKLFLILYIVSTFSFADDCTNCTTEVEPFEDIAKNIETLKAPTVVNCEDQLSKDAEDEYLTNFGNLSKEQKKIQGIKLEGSRLELNFLKKMLGDKPTDKWSLAADCKTVVCALLKVYDSKEAAHRALNIAKRDGYIVSIEKSFNVNNEYMGQNFTPSELRDIDLAYKLLPSNFGKLKSLDYIKRMPKGLSLSGQGNAAAFAQPGFDSAFYKSEGEITFLDNAFGRDKSWTPFVAVHEIAHHYDFSKTKNKSYGVSESPEFLKLSGWNINKSLETDKNSGLKKLVERWDHDKDKKFVRDYAATSPAEDFAEAVANYVFRPKYLKDISPDKYEFLKSNIFKGKEYLEEIKSNITKNELIYVCLNSTKNFRLYGLGKVYYSDITSSCLDDYVKNLQTISPDLCSYNKDQIKDALYDDLTNSVDYLNNILAKCDQQLPKLENDCYAENDYRNDCLVKRYFTSNLLSPEALGLNEEDTKKLQDHFSSKVSSSKFAHLNYEVKMDSIVNKMGINNFLSEMLISGLSDSGKITTNLPLSMQKDFDTNAVLGLSKKLEAEGYKFDTKENLKIISKSYLILNKKLNSNLKSFQEIVFKNATRSKDKNLELIKKWAASESIEYSPRFEELAITLKKYDKLFK